MGSEKYPEENSFDMYCSKHGGYTDANTDYESVGHQSLYAAYVHVLWRLMYCCDVLGFWLSFFAVRVLFHYQ